MSSKTKSPKINSISWGKVVVGGREFKDAKLFPGGCGEWDWKETGTRHVPGIQPADVEELIKKGARTIILSKGFNERLEVCQTTKNLLSERNINLYILQTEKAVSKYNQLRKKEQVGALIHSTC